NATDTPPAATSRRLSQHRRPDSPPHPQAPDAAERVHPDARVDDLPPLHTPADRIGLRLRGYWTPPTGWADAPASLRAVARYARYGAWTKQQGPLRVLGIAYSWLALAATTGLYYAAWIVQRPGRLTTCAIVYALVAHTPLGAWLPWA